MPFQPGKSGNPSGRPKSAVSIAKHAARETRDGTEVIDFLIATMRDPKAGRRERVACAVALLDRIAGKPLQPTELAVTLAQEHVLSYPPRWDEMTGTERAGWLLAHRQHLLTSGGEA